MIDEMTGEGVVGDRLMSGPMRPAGRGRAARKARPLTPEELRRRRMLAIGVVAICAAAIGLACWRYVPGVLAWLSDAQAVRAFVDEHAVLSRMVMVGINIAQVVLAFLPGEPVELASGYAFGFWEGTLLCILASAIARSLVYGAVRRWGWNVVGLFFDRSHLDRFSWLQDARRVEVAMFIVFLIPGTPKDFLTYFAGLTKMSYPSVLLISTVGTIPSIVTSTMAASAFGSGNYALAILVVIVAAVLLAVGAVVYRWYARRSERP